MYWLKKKSLTTKAQDLQSPKYNMPGQYYHIRLEYHIDVIFFLSDEMLTSLLEGI